MSTLRVDNFAPSGGGTSFPAKAIPKMTACFNQQTPAVRDSVNVASVTDNGAGDFTYNYTNNFADANYSFVFNAGGDSSGSDGFAYGSWLKGGSGAVPTTSSQDVYCGFGATGATGTDNEYQNSMISGDLA